MVDAELLSQAVALIERARVAGYWEGYRDGDNHARGVDR